LYYDRPQQDRASAYLPVDNMELGGFMQEKSHGTLPSLHKHKNNAGKRRMLLSKVIIPNCIEKPDSSMICLAS
jgi:hypothetical protein